MKLDDINTGDYLYYTERPYSNYADSLIHVRNVDGVNMAHPVCTNYDGKYINDTGKADWSNDLPVAIFFDDKCWFPTNYKEEYGRPAEWMSEHYPLSA
jgi:hypothetical protein